MKLIPLAIGFVSIILIGSIFVPNVTDAGKQNDITYSNNPKVWCGR